MKNIYINNLPVGPDWKPADSVTSLGYVSLDGGSTLAIPDSVTSLGDVRLYGGSTLAMSANCHPTIRGHELPDAETARARLIDVARNALAKPRALDMSVWHNESRECGTSHCIAGWAVHLAGEAGYALEREVSQPAAGNILLGLDAAKLFFVDADTARTALHKVLADAEEAK